MQKNKLIKISLLIGIPLVFSIVFMACKKSFLDQQTIGVLTEAQAKVQKAHDSF